MISAQTLVCTLVTYFASKKKKKKKKRGGGVGGEKQRGGGSCFPGDSTNVFIFIP